ncbi:hypothetical protein [Microbacterium sp. MPKO10]|uniref:hypothetical protein n=1 Tax=Microbacterium sp. MPKO10 TaxID=2989818 RepID=UPI00223639F7|nr:hypothetical protein [Microbacterium sp. MPKO10]MCW4459681.1 hypothetical protein [Microbacterium sp. MPKO10]
MTSFSDEQPLSRRQRRERLRAQQAHDSVLQSQKPPQGDEPDASTLPAEETPAEKRETPLTGDRAASQNAEDAPAAPQAVTGEPSTGPSPSAESEGRPLTRRELRALRAETGQTQIVTPTGLQNGDEPPLPAPQPARPSIPDDAPVPPPSEETAQGSPTGQRKPAAPKPAPAKKSKAAKKAAKALKAQKPEAADSDATAKTSSQPEGPDDKPATGKPESREAEGVASSGEKPVEAPRPPDSEKGSSQSNADVSSAFSARAGEEGGDGAARAFDTLVAPEARGSDVFTTSSVLILPGAPSKPTQSPVPGSDGPLVTGSVDLPRSKARDRQSGAERSDVDTGRDNGADTTATAGTPVSATKAVSTHAVTRDVITPPTKASSSKLLMILAITAGVLCVAVIGVVIVGLMTGSF